MGRIDEDTRLAAVVAWRSASGHYKTAMQLFKQHPKFKSISRPDRVLKHYSLRAAQGQGLQDRQRSGRPRKLDQPTTARATQLFLAGSAQNGRQESFTGINEALSLNEELKGIVSTHNMSPRTLLRNMQSHTPSLKKRTEDLKPILNTRLKNLRPAACSKLLQFSDGYFKRIFWIDAKTMHIVPSARRVMGGQQSAHASQIRLSDAAQWQRPPYLAFLQHGNLEHWTSCHHVRHRHFRAAACSTLHGASTCPEVCTRGPVASEAHGRMSVCMHPIRLREQLKLVQRLLLTHAQS